MSSQAIGPIFGGVLTTGLDWRAIFWFLAIISGTSCLSFLLFFKDTFRRERSLTYQNVLRHRLKIDSIQNSTALKNNLMKNSKEVVDEEKQKPELPTTQALPDIKLSLKDVSPFKPIWMILRRKNNLVILSASGAYGFGADATSAYSSSQVFCLLSDF